MEAEFYVAWIDHRGEEQILFGDMTACGLAHDALKGAKVKAVRSGWLVNGKAPAELFPREIVK